MGNPWVFCGVFFFRWFQVHSLPQNPKLQRDFRGRSVFSNPSPEIPSVASHKPRSAGEIPASSWAPPLCGCCLHPATALAPQKNLLHSTPPPPPLMVPTGTPPATTGLRAGSSSSQPLGQLGIPTQAVGGRERYSCPLKRIKCGPCPLRSWRFGAGGEGWGKQQARTPPIPLRCLKTNVAVQGAGQTWELDAEPATQNLLVREPRCQHPVISPSRPRNPARSRLPSGNALGPENGTVTRPTARRALPWHSQSGGPAKAPTRGPAIQPPVCPPTPVRTPSFIQGIGPWALVRRGAEQERSGGQQGP